MKNHGKTIRGWFCLAGCLLGGMLILFVSGPVFAKQTEVPAGRILFENRQARVKIIQTPAGVILKITTDVQGRQTVTELNRSPAQPPSTK